LTLSDLSIRRPVLTWMMTLALAVFGVLGYARLGVDRFPRMEFPTVSVTSRLDGATPEAMEEDVTDVLEEQLSIISGVRSIRSSSFSGTSQIVVEFELGTDLEVAIQDVRDKVSVAGFRLPPQIEPPVVTKMDVTDFPVAYVPFSSTRPVAVTSDYLKRNVKPLLETIPGVSGVNLLGERERNIRIWLDGEALRGRGLAAGDVLSAFRREHVERPGGIVEGAQLEWSVKTAAEFRSIAELESMVVSHRGDAITRLADVARVEDGEEDVRTIHRYNGQPTVALGITKQSDGNTVSIMNEVYRRIEAIRPLLPAGISVVEPAGWIDFSLGIREAVEETLFALAFGGLLAVLVVFVFLRRTRPTLIVGAAIPLSLVATFGLVWMAGYTLNVMTLLGMTLAIGVVIDDAIIVLENIERHREAGKRAFEAAVDGTRQITFAASAATFSVAVVFLPVVFAEGLVGSFLGEFGLTVAGSVVISLFVALTLTPMLAARMPPPAARAQGSLYHRLERWLRGLEERYGRVLDWALAHRLATFAIALGSLAMAIGFGSRLGGELFPPADSGMILTRFQLAPGTSLEAASAVLARDEAFFLGLPETAGLFSNAGGDQGLHAGTPSAGFVTATLVPSDRRRRSTQEVIREARRALGEVPGQRVQIADPTGGFGSYHDFEVEVRGNLALAELDRHASEIQQRLAARPGFVDLDKSLRVGLPELRVVPDREKAASLGVDAAELAEAVQVMIGGLDVGVFKEAGGRYDIRMRLDRAERDRPQAIEELYVRGREGGLVELRNLVRLETGAAASAITRSSRQRSVSLTANLEGVSLEAALAEASAIAREVLPEGVRLAPAGRAESMQESFRQFRLLLGLSLLAIYMALAAQFESFVHPISVMLALPFSMVGALGGLYAASFWNESMTLNLFSGIGIILLLGLVTKNSILLVDYANQLRADGMSAVEAMRRAAPVRMRPVVMTGLSMIFGVLPAAAGIGPGAETRAPMGVATAAGMLSSLLLTLLVVPVFYVFLDGLEERARAFLARGRRRPQPAPHPAPPLPADTGSQLRGRRAS
jgi:HAE1 family hydrophobic/amphiphilic exporter-1